MNKSLDRYFPESQPVQAKSSTSINQQVNKAPSYFLLASCYDGEKKSAFLKLYDVKDQKIKIWYDDSDHKPYCLSDQTIATLKENTSLTEHSGLDHFDTITKYNALKDQKVSMSLVVAKDPLSIGGRPSGTIRDIIRVWEADIKYVENYLYDRDLEPGMPYDIRDGKLHKIKTSIPQNIANNLANIVGIESEEYRLLSAEWIRLLEAPIIHFKRVGFDIEVSSPIATRMPDANVADDPIICVGAKGSDGIGKILLLKREGVENGNEEIPNEVKMQFCETEEDLIRETFKLLTDYPFIITFNGDDFDLKYIRNRAQKLGFKKEDIPIELGRDFATTKSGIHIDLYKFFFNRSIQIYAFSQKYREKTLNEIGNSLVNMPKKPIESHVSKLSYTELASYCYRDSDITLRLTEFEDELVMKLITVLARISYVGLEDVTRQGVSAWIKSMMYKQHRKRGYLIPRQDEIMEEKGGTATEATIKGKKYKGAIVVEPVPGIHFNVAVLDFPSLYPSIIKIWNLGYQSVRCYHPECKTNLIPNTSHWVCTRKRGLESLLIGSLRDLRVRWYKARSYDKELPADLRNWYSITQGALKVILNASYGVFGSDSFDLYCPPVAEATAAIGRHAITQIQNRAKNLGIQVLYGDTDSLFLKNPSKEQISGLTRWTEEKLKMGIDVEKVYRYAVFSSRKKNYLGILKDGTVDVKGLTGKKRHIPSIIKTAFNKMKERLAQVQNPSEFEAAKKDIAKIVHDRYITIKRRRWEKIEELAFHVVLGEDPDRYTKTTPQHVKAARILQK
ncbi:DNA-directed DNA polymerase I, partial [Candidatus Bathyarchaeota archaeon]|nr:DNA-directed DNA polymerase I [Candidatus Bathyarchaeota archaeon]